MSFVKNSNVDERLIRYVERYEKGVPVEVKKKHRYAIERKVTYSS